MVEVEDMNLDESKVSFVFAETEEGKTQTTVKPVMSSQQDDQWARDNLKFLISFSRTLGSICLDSKHHNRLEP